MRWRKARESDNVVQSSGGGGGFGHRLPFRGSGLGLGGIAAVVVVSLMLGLNPLDTLLMVSGGGSPANDMRARYQQESAPVTSDDPQIQFVRAVLGSTEDVWGAYFRQAGSEYEQPKINLFRGAVRSGCGAASAASGPFYCPPDHRIYLDLSFFQEMENRFQAAGEFARAYVIAHEVGHHVQELLGFTDRVARARAAGKRTEGADGPSVRLELQADCLAGVWAHHSEKQLAWLQEGDIEAALNAARQIGDDMLQKQSQGFAVPDSFTHGTSAQRERWFRTGFSAGDMRQCDTFSGDI